MLVIRKTKDLMIDVSEYPHIPSDMSLKQAIGVIKASMLETPNCYHPMIALVVGDKGLAGTLRLRDILKGLEPSFLKPSENVQGYTEGSVELSIIWDLLFDKEAKQLAERPVKEVMNPIKVHVSPDDPVVKAAYLMIHNDLLVLPVLEKKKNKKMAVVGMIRMMEVFDALSGSVLEPEEKGLITELRKLI